MGEPSDCIAYRYHGNVYLNITNRCPVACVFCIRHADDYRLENHRLKLENEPEADVIVTAALRQMAAGDYGEIVFCGMGEPLMRPDTVRRVATALKERGAGRIRIDTCGLCDMWHGRDLTAELAPVVDALSISLNAGNANDYARVCPSQWGKDAYYSLLDFIVRSRERFKDVRLSAVHPNAYHALGRECPVNLEACRRIADLLGLPLHIRGQNPAA